MELVVQSISIFHFSITTRYQQPPSPQQASPVPPRRCTRASSSEQGRLVGALHHSTTPMTSSPRLPHQRHQGCHNLHQRPHPLHRRPRPPRPPTSSAEWRPRTAGRGSGAERGTQPRWGSPPSHEGRRWPRTWGGANRRRRGQE